MLHISYRLDRPCRGAKWGTTLPVAPILPHTTYAIVTGNSLQNASATHRNQNDTAIAG